MKSIHFAKKYRLREGTDYINHQQFGIDFGHGFQSRLELYKTFTNWSHPRFLELLDEMEKTWNNIDKKTAGNLPEKLWNWIYWNILIPVKSTEFPEIAEEEKRIEAMDIGGLKTYLRGDGIKSYFGNIVGAEMEWDHYAPDNAVGDLEIRPNYSMQRVKEKIYENGTYLDIFAYEELKYQLTKYGYARAKVQFRMHRERRDRERNFNWREFSYRQMFGIFNEQEYDVYFETLKLDKNKVKEKDITKAYYKLSFNHHPDKGGDVNKFVEITEAKNKCIEYIMIKAKKGKSHGQHFR